MKRRVAYPSLNSKRISLFWDWKNRLFVICRTVHDFRRWNSIKKSESQIFHFDRHEDRLTRSIEKSACRGPSLLTTINSVSPREPMVYPLLLGRVKDEWSNNRFSYKAYLRIRLHVILSRLLHPSGFHAKLRFPATRLFIISQKVVVKP